MLLGFIYLVLDLSNKKSFKIDILIGVLAGILILTRRDFMLVYIFSLFYLLIFLKINYKKIFIIFIISIVSLSPYLIRNFIAFDKLIIHSGFGYNVWKAYNPNAKVEGYYYESNELTVKTVVFNNFVRYGECALLPWWL